MKRIIISICAFVSFSTMHAMFPKKSDEKGFWAKTGANMAQQWQRMKEQNQTTQQRNVEAAQKSIRDFLTPAAETRKLDSKPLQLGDAPRSKVEPHNPFLETPKDPSGRMQSLEDFAKQDGKPTNNPFPVKPSEQRSFYQTLFTSMFGEPTNASDPTGQTKQGERPQLGEVKPEIGISQTLSQMWHQSFTMIQQGLEAHDSSPI